MAEWLKAHAWKACVRETVPWVRIPLSPPSTPKQRNGHAESQRWRVRPYRSMRASRSATSEIIAGVVVAIALTATVYYGYLAWLLVSPD